MPKKAKSAPRVAIDDDVRAEVLKRCLRHCCMCFGLHGRFEVIDGQIAHVDRNRANARIENLVYLCQACHTVYDTTNNRVVSFTPGELSFYRDQLYRKLLVDFVEWTLTVRCHRSQYGILKNAVNTAQDQLRTLCSDVFLNERPLNQS